jgi:putative transposase
MTVHHRRSIRLRYYDYSQPGSYFVTICTYNHECLFGDVIDGEMVLNHVGRIVREEWLKSVCIRKEIDLDNWVIMPNHIQSDHLLPDSNPLQPNV